MYKFIKGILPLVMVLPKITKKNYYYYYSEFTSDSCVVAYVQDKILPQPQKLYTGVPVMPVKNSRSDFPFLIICYGTDTQTHTWTV